MKFIKLTNRENEVMNILWSCNENMSATDIMESLNGISINTIQQALRKLLNAEYIKVSGIGKNKKAITRLYSPAITEADYISHLIVQKDTGVQLASSFIKETDDIEILSKFEKLIQEKRKEIKEK